MIIDSFDLARPLILRLPPEMAHRLTIFGLKLGLGGLSRTPDDPILAIERFGLRFSNPIGLAAGFDKNGEVVEPMLRLGFGFVEIGTVTPHPQEGNPKPRIVRLPAQRAVINRLGFNNRGLESAAGRMALRQEAADRPAGWIGGNIGRNKDSTDAVADYVRGAERLSPVVDYLTVNVSSPNTPGLRSLQSRGALTELLTAVKAARVRAVPVLVKIAPDLDETGLKDVARAAADTGIDGIIVSNTTIERPAGLPRDLAAQTGGLSGPPLFPLATEILRRMYRLTEGGIPLIGVGGIASADDAYVKIRAGASLLQLYTALIFEGPGLIRRLKAGLAARLESDGFGRLEDAIGADLR
jgi:dihydroorotate dehydrogenase